MPVLRAEHNLEDKHGLWLVHEPRSPLRAVCDIVAVHGLGGGPASTWKHKQTHYLWLRDCLPTILEDIPKGTSARIWTFGYNANTVFSPAVAGISEFTQSLLGFVDEAGIGHEGRKVIFVAHSLGGVVVKSALIDASRRSSQHSWLLDATIGIVFLATPHQGSKIANKGAYLAKIAKYTGVVRPNREVLQSLKQNSGELFDKVEQFRGICGGIKICSFFETLTLGSFGLIVEKSSAMIGLPGEEWIPLNADHKTICKFESSADMNLKLVQNSIKKMMQIGITSYGGNLFMNLPVRPARDDSNGGPGRVGLYQSSRSYPSPQRNDRQQMPQPWGNYQAPPVSPYPEDGDSTSSYEAYKRPPSTNTSYRSFNGQNPEGNFQGQSSTPSPQPTFRQGRDPAMPNESQSRFTQNTPSPSGQYRSQSTSFLNTGTMPSQPSQETNTSASRSPYLRPRPSTYSLNKSQLADSNRNTSPAPPRKPVPSPPSPPAEDLAYMCDACMEWFGNKSARFRCTACENYDLCPRCYQKGSTSKGHDIKHKVMSISKTHQLKFNDITPANVVPQESPPRTLPNWTVDEEERRWLHLRASPSQERYILHGLAKGAYLVQLVIKFKFSDHVSTATLNQLKGQSLGELKVVAGAPSDTKVFFADPKKGTEDVNLARELFSSGRMFTLKLELPQDVTDPKKTWIKVCDFSATPIHIGTGSEGNKAFTAVAILLQWSNVRKFQTNENPVLLCTLDCMRLDELLEYDEPSPPTTRATIPQPPAQQPPAPSSYNPAADDDDDDHVTLEELIDAAKILIDNNKAVTSENLLTIVMATRKVQSEFQKALLLRHIQQVQEQQRREREQRERLAAQRAAQAQAAGELMLLSWLLNQ